MLCAFFKQGSCSKGDKCKFSHDLSLERKGEKKSIYVDSRDEELKNGKIDFSIECLLCFLPSAVSFVLVTNSVYTLAFYLRKINCHGPYWYQLNYLAMLYDCVLFIYQKWRILGGVTCP